MRKLQFKKIALGIILHFVCSFLFIIVAIYLFHTYIEVDYLSESKVYYLDPFNKGTTSFEDTEVFDDIFNHEISDLLTYIAVSMDMETNGRFDSKKPVDVIAYASRGMSDRISDTAVYFELEDLIKWGKEGLHYSKRIMSLNDFVSYFDDYISPEYFNINEDGTLYFTGFDAVNYTQKEYNTIDSNAELQITGKENLNILVTGNTNRDILISQGQNNSANNNYNQVYDAMRELPTEDLQELVFSYLMNYVEDYVTINREDDNMTTVSFSQLECKYSPTNGKKTLYAEVDNWIDFFHLQNSISVCAEDFSANYDIYRKGSKIFGATSSNLKYILKLRAEDQSLLYTITNLPEYEASTDEGLTEIFSENLKYIIYYAEELEYATLTSVSENILQDIVRNVSYNYPDNTRIWIYVDPDYPSSQDAFYDAHYLFSKNKEWVHFGIGAFILLVIVWIVLFLYLATMINAYTQLRIHQNETGIPWYDRIWTEIVLLAFCATLYLYYQGFHILRNISITVYNTHSSINNISGSNVISYAYFAIFGFCFSTGILIFTSALIRRGRYGNLCSDSLLIHLKKAFYYVVQLISRHKNIAVNTLIPYNLFLLINLIGTFVCTRYYASQPKLSVLVGLILVGIDALIGVYLFRGGAEKREIVDGITRIRDGETDYKLETSQLTGTNQDLADAVNNIGEGIRKAVQTSMRDEQMKSDLITNVSHDLKTPLTSIINYVDLLKRQQITETPASDYIQILDDKSKRLKQLLDDLLEASKISSGNIEIKLQQLNLTELMKQTVGEFEDKFSEKNLVIVFEKQDNCYILADGRQLWRIVDNLFNNVYKYALEGTRVYIDVTIEDNMCRLSVKNISAQPNTVQGKDLTERFIRGDSSRTTEGSGLGLFIAKSLTEAQKGTMLVSADGDLFKVTLEFPEYVC